MQDIASQLYFFSREWVLHPRWRTPGKMFSRAGVLRPIWHTPSKIFSRAWALNGGHLLRFQKQV